MIDGTRWVSRRRSIEVPGFSVFPQLFVQATTTKEKRLHRFYARRSGTRELPTSMMYFGRIRVKSKISLGVSDREKRRRGNKRR